MKCIELVLFPDEDYESAVRALNGKLYPDPPEAAACSEGKCKTTCYFWCLEHIN